MSSFSLFPEVALSFRPREGVEQMHLIGSVITEGIFESQRLPYF